MSFPRYPEYKGSGVEWLGQVPEHWEVVPLWSSATCNDEVLTESTDPETEINYVEISDVDSSGNVLSPSTLLFKDAPSRARRVIRSEDVLVSTVRTYLRAIAPIRSVAEGTIASTGFAVIRPKNIDSRLLGYLCRAEHWISEVIARSVGVSYPAINASELMKLKIPLAQQEEQATIANFLDQETAKIDALITEQKKLIELLKEKRQAVISHAVTKGLDPNVNMKDSGVEWLGQVPEHWGVMPLKHFVSMKSGEQITSDEIEETGVYPVYGGNGLRGFTRSWTHEGEYCLIGRQGALCGNINYAKGKFWASEHAVVVTPKFSCDLLFLGELLTIMDLGQYSTSAAQPGLSVEVIGNIRIPFLSLSDQLNIGFFLREQINSLKSLAEESSSAIRLLQERRSALISAAVTGQIDVRNFVPEAEQA